jgi:3-phenylpropionate/trans-cinnamate dioxygenase ferredoxin reductase subunit
MNRIVVVGASVAGLNAAETLREEGFSGELVLVNGERHAGYDRPPLSKQVLDGRKAAADLTLKPADFYSTLALDHRVGVRARQLDLRARAVILDTGEQLGFDGLLIATGLRPRPLHNQRDVRGIHMLRTLDDAQALRGDLLDAEHVVVVGAGFLGCEIAATARIMGLRVTLVDPLELPMLRQLGSEVAAAVLRTHVERGVELRMQRVVARFEHRSGRVTGVTLDDGTRLDAQVVVVAAGSLPNTEWLHDSGVPVDDGVVCDEFCRAADDVYAAGDVAKWRHPRSGELLRVEHRTHAAEHGIAAARNMLGAATAFDPLPYFWTDFYDARVQVFGRIGALDTMTVATGEIGERGFTATFSRDGVITAVLGWNAAREVRRMSALLGQCLPALGAPQAVRA